MAALGLGLLGLLGLAAGTSVTVTSGQQECFVLSLAKGQAAYGNFEVLQEQLSNKRLKKMKVFILGPEQKTMYLNEGRSDGSFAFTAEDEGDYTLCIENGNKKKAGSVEVGFAYRKSAEIKSTTDLAATVMEILQGLQDLSDHQSYMREREELHRDISESTNYRVLVWTLVEAIVLGIMTIWQIMYIRKFFEVKRVV